MNTKTLLEILSAPPRSNEELAVNILRAAEGASTKSLEDAFAVALGVGKLSDRTARSLVSTLEWLGSAAALEQYDLLADDEIEPLKEEVAELLGRRRQLRNEQRLTSKLRDEVSALQSLCEEARLKKNVLGGEISETQSRIDRVAQIDSELQQ